MTLIIAPRRKSRGELILPLLVGHGEDGGVKRSSPKARFLTSPQKVDHLLLAEHYPLSLPLDHPTQNGHSWRNLGHPTASRTAGVSATWTLLDPLVHRSLLSLRKEKDPELGSTTKRVLFLRSYISLIY